MTNPTTPPTPPVPTPPVTPPATPPAETPTTFRSQVTGQTAQIAPPPDAIVPRRRVQGSDRRQDGPFVQYVGEASHRIIRPHQWKATKGVGPDNLKNPNATHTWSHKNEKVIPSSEFSDHQLDYLLCDDMQPRGGHSFVEVNYNDKGQLVQVHQLEQEKQNA